MIYTKEVEEMCPVAKGVDHGPAPIPEEGKWVQAKEIKDISGLTHGIGWCAPQQGACKLTLNVKDGIIEEALVETLGCSGMTHSAAMAGEILVGKTFNPANAIVEILPVIGMTATTFAFRCKTAKATRLLGLVSSPAWLIYNIVNFAIGAICCEVFSLISIIVGLIRLDGKISKEKDR